MADLFLLSLAQMGRIERYFPLSHGVARVDDRRVISGILHVIKSGCRWCDCPPEYGPSMTIYNRFVRWAERGVWERLFRELAARGRSGFLGGLIRGRHRQQRGPRRHEGGQWVAAERLQGWRVCGEPGRLRPGWFRSG